MAEVEAPGEIAGPRLWAVAALFLIPLYLWAGLGNRDLWAPDEPRFALVAREMQERRNYALPTINGEVYAHKPPLLFWSIGVASVLTGRDASDGFTARLPSALAGAGTLVVTGLIADRLFGRRVAWLAPLVLATAHLFCWQAHHAQIDALLCFWVAVAMLCLVRHRQGGELKWALAFQLACSLGVLAKGVGVIFPWALAWAWGREKDEQGTPQQLFRPLPLLVFALPLVAWLSAAAMYGGREYLEALIGKHVLKRFADSLGDHDKPFYFFLLDTPPQFLPWTVLAPAMLLYVRDHWRERGVRFAVLWFLSMLAFFSFPKGKRGLYMLPSFPALSMLAAATLDAAAQGAERLRKFALPGLALVGVAFAVLMRVSGNVDARAGMNVDVRPLQVALGAAVLMVGAGVWRWSVPAMTRAVVAGTVVVYFSIYGAVLGQLDPVKSSRAFCQQGVVLRKPGEPLGYFGVFLEAYALFSGEKLLVGERPEEFAPHLEKHASILVFLQAEYMKHLREVPGIRIQVLTEKKLGDKNMVIARVSK